MFRLFDAEDENKFTWESIGDVIDGRKNLGKECPYMYTDYFNLRLKMNWSNALGKRLSLTFSEMQVNWQEENLQIHLLNLELPFNEFIAHLQGSSGRK